jgi:hypothetical protein
MAEPGKGRQLQRIGQYGHYSRGLHLSPSGRKETEDTHGTLKCATAKVSVGPEHCHPNSIPKQSTRQMGSQASPAGSIQSAADSATLAATAARPEAELSAVQPSKQQQSLFQLWQLIPFHPRLSSTQEIFPRANIQPEQQGQGQGQEEYGTSPPGEGELHNSLRTPQGCANNDGYFLYKPSTRDYTF